MGVFEQAVANIAYLRAQSGGGMSRLNFAADSLASMETNMRAAIGRGRDIAASKPSQVLNPNSSICSHGGPSQHHQRCVDAPEVREKLICKRKSHESNQREEDRMSPVLLSVITDDPLYNNPVLPSGLCPDGAEVGGLERVCLFRRLLAQTTGTDRRAPVIQGKVNPCHLI